MISQGTRVARVLPGSLASTAGIRRGDTIVAVDRHRLSDSLDYLFHSSAERLSITTRSQTGATRTVLLSRSRASQPLGIELEPFALRRCRNRCVFCFVHQLPRGLRKELYIKDDDYRLSFLHGNYISATDLSEADLDRIVRLRLSPLYISVHTTDPALRARMFGRSRPLDIVKVLRFFKRHKIAFHAQIVLCPGINDGGMLQKTLDDLVALHPALRSIAIVPVGLTQHRGHLPRLQPVTQRYARNLVKAIEPLRRSIRSKYGADILFASDEFYLLAGRRPPAYRNLEPIPQIENGVGMVAEFYRHFAAVRRRLPSRVVPPRRIGVVTSPLGRLALARLLTRLDRISGLRVTPIVIENTLLGRSVTVSGLLPGRDILRALSPLTSFDLFVIPGNCLRLTDQLFLDDLSLATLRKKLEVPVVVVEEDARDFVRAILSSDFHF